MDETTVEPQNNTHLHPTAGTQQSADLNPGFFIRPAKLSDLVWITSELIKFSDFIPTKRKIFTGSEKTIEKIADLIESHFFAIADHATHGPVGMFCGMLMPHPMNEEIPTFMELFWWVSEEFRHSRAGLMLLNAGIEYGKNNAEFITISLESKSPIKDESLEKRGFVQLERTFLMEVN